MSAEKYPCTFSREMETIVYIFAHHHFCSRAIGLNTSRDRMSPAETGEYLRLSYLYDYIRSILFYDWRRTCHVSLVKTQ